LVRSLLVVPFWSVAPSSSVALKKSLLKFSEPLNIRCSNRWAKPERADRLVLGADVVPDVDRHDRGLVIFVHDHGQAVVQREAGERNVDRRQGGQSARRAGSRRRRGRRAQAWPQRLTEAKATEAATPPMRARRRAVERMEILRIARGP
jgi:hypothetical protein